VKTGNDLLVFICNLSRGECLDKKLMTLVLSSFLLLWAKMIGIFIGESLLMLWWRAREWRELTRCQVFIISM